MIMDNLNVFPFYASLTTEEKEEFKSLLHPVREKKGEILHYQGDICQNTLLLTKGRVRLYTQDTYSSMELTLYTLQSGEQCLSQIISQLNDTIAIPSAVAETDIEGYFVNRKEIEHFIEKVPSYQNFIISLYAKKIIDLVLTLQSVQFKQLDVRILDFLSKEKKTQLKLHIMN